MDIIAGVLMLATTIEGIIQYLKPILGPLVDRLPIPNPYLYIATILGIVGSFMFMVDITTVLVPGVETTPVLGEILTGIVVARGSNFVHDLFGRLGVPVNEGG